MSAIISVELVQPARNLCEPFFITLENLECVYRDDNYYQHASNRRVLAQALARDSFSVEAVVNYLVKTGDSRTAIMLAITLMNPKAIKSLRFHRNSEVRQIVERAVPFHGLTKTDDEERYRVMIIAVEHMWDNRPWDI